MLKLLSFQTSGNGPTLTEFSIEKCTLNSGLLHTTFSKPFQSRRFWNLDFFLLYSCVFQLCRIFFVPELFFCKVFFSCPVAVSFCSILFFSCPIALFVCNILFFSCPIAVFFLEFWKRKEITLAYHWDVLEYEEEEVILSNQTFNFWGREDGGSSVYKVYRCVLLWRVWFSGSLVLERV